VLAATRQAALLLTGSGVLVVPRSRTVAGRSTSHTNAPYLPQRH
jgi:hypothetical protein